MVALMALAAAVGIAGLSWVALGVLAQACSSHFL